MGIEPTYPAWKAGVLPLNHARIFQFSFRIIPFKHMIVNVFVDNFRDEYAKFLVKELLWLFRCCFAQDHGRVLGRRKQEMRFWLAR